MGDNQGDDTAARRLNAIRSYRFKASENVLTEETVFLLGQIDARDAVLRERDAEIERLCLAIGGLRMRIEDQGNEIERLKVALADRASETKMSDIAPKRRLTYEEICKHVIAGAKRMHETKP